MQVSFVNEMRACSNHSEYMEEHLIIRSNAIP